MGRKDIVLLVFTVCANLFFIIPGSVVSSGKSAESGRFTGTWVANGSKDVLSFDESRETAIFKLSGHVNLKNQVGKESDYWSECIGLADTATGSELRCVWRSLNGQEIYLTLEGDQLSEGNNVTGTIVGGNKAAKGISGSVMFQWSSMSAHSINNKNNIGGYANELSGSYQLP
ncbi:hypothetical protein [Desulforhopalus sp. 52FAK]